MPTVKNPPALVAQETPNWCFAAAEVMVREYYGLATLTQYEIAKKCTNARALLENILNEELTIARVQDVSLQAQELDGDNLNSYVVQAMRKQRNAFDHISCGGKFVSRLTAEVAKGEIDSDRIFVVGNTTHYFVVYGYSDDGATLHVLDPLPVGRGGKRTTLTLKELVGSEGNVTILFPRRE